MARIPRLLHVNFGMRPQLEPFSPVHYVAIESARRLLGIERVVMHCEHLPYGLYWDLLRPTIELRRVQAVHEVEQRSQTDHFVARYRYAHHSDVVRLDALIAEGGLYIDLDTVTLRPFPEEWWDCSFVIGQEKGFDVPSLLNAVMLCEPGAPFAMRWREEILDRLDGSWSGHSCRLAAELAADTPSDIEVVDAEAFAAFGSSPESLSQLLSKPGPAAATNTSAYVAHLSAHLWWEEERTDFLALSGSDIDERWIATSASPYAQEARCWLPRLDLR